MGDNTSVRFAGKVDAWFYAVFAVANLILLASLLPALDPSKQGGAIALVVLLVCFLALDGLTVPMLVRNYVEFDGEGNLVIVFGLSKVVLPVGSITSVRETNNPLASLAASLDRIEIKAGYNEVMIAVKDKEAFYQELTTRNPNAILERKPTNV